MIHGLIAWFRRMPKWLLTAVFVVAIVAFMVVYLRDTDFSRLEQLRINGVMLAIATLWTLAFRYWMVLIWRVILRALGSVSLPHFHIMAYIYAKAWLSRYIPGTVTWIAGRIYMASKYGISKSRLAVSSLLEGGMQVVASAIVSLIILGLSPHFDLIPLAAKLLLVAVSCACLVVLFPPVFNRMLHQAFRLFRKRVPSKELHINGKAVIRSFVLFAIGTFINGTGAYFLILALAPHVSLDSYLYIVGVFGISGAIGIAVPFVPSGLGVRDGILLVLLAVILPKELALALTVFSRLWLMAIDVVFLGATAAAHRLQSQSNNKPV